MNRAVVFPIIAGALAWVGVLELLDGNYFLGVNTWLGAVYILLSAGIYARKDEIPEARSAFPSHADNLPVDAPRAGVDATFSER